jgi:hypothetical protein
MTKNEIKGQLRKIVKGESRQAIADTVSDILIMAECNAPKAQEVWNTKFSVAYHGNGVYTLSS